MLYLLVDQCIQTFDVRTSNYSESENSRILTNGIRSATPFKMLLMLIRDVVQKTNNSVLKAQHGFKRDQKFTEAAFKKIQHHTRQDAGKFSVRYSPVSKFFMSPDWFFFVHGVVSVIVEITTCLCSLNVNMASRCRVKRKPLFRQIILKFRYTLGLLICKTSRAVACTLSQRECHVHMYWQ